MANKSHTVGKKIIWNSKHAEFAATRIRQNWLYVVHGMQQLELELPFAAILQFRIFQLDLSFMRLAKWWHLCMSWIFPWNWNWNENNKKKQHWRRARNENVYGTCSSTINFNLMPKRINKWKSKKAYIKVQMCPCQSLVWAHAKNVLGFNFLSDNALACII